MRDGRLVCTLTKKCSSLILCDFRSHFALGMALSSRLWIPRAFRRLAFAS